MKSTIFIFLLFISEFLYAGEHVRVFPTTAKSFVTGNTVSVEDQAYLLFTEKACHLPLEDNRNIFYFVQLPGTRVMRRGCWYPTLDDGYVIIYANGEMTKQPLWESLPRGELNADGSVTITEKNYDSATFMSETIKKQNKRLLKKRESGDY